MKYDTPKIDVHSTEGHRTTLRQPTFSMVDGDLPDNHNHFQLVSPFLAWDIIDEFGEIEKVSLPDRVDRFLKAIYSRIVTEAEIEVEGKTENQVQEYLQTLSKDSLALVLGQDFRLIFELYVPAGQYSASRPIEVYWGIVYEIVQVSPRSLRGRFTVAHTEFII